MRKLLLSGASIALLSLGAATLPSLADSPSTLADPIGDAPAVQLADSGTVTSDGTTTTEVEDTTQPSNTAPDAGRADEAAEEAAAAADDEPVPTGQLAAAAVQPAGTVMIDELLGADVIDVNGEDVASVDAVLLAPDGRLTHVVISYGGFLGIGTKEVLLPWESVSYNAAQETLQIRGNEADLETAPGFVTQEELLDQQEAERAAEATPSPTGVLAPQQAQTPDPE